MINRLKWTQDASWSQGDRCNKATRRERRGGGGGGGGGGQGEKATEMDVRSTGHH